MLKENYSDVRVYKQCPYPFAALSIFGGKCILFQQIFVKEESILMLGGSFFLLAQ